MITLYQYASVWGLPNASPFCLKLETFLRMVDLPYEIKITADPRRSPKKKLPYVRIDGKVMSDSELIIDFLKEKHGNFLDEHLTEEQKALSVLLDDTFSERLYWMIVYFRWQQAQGWSFLKKDYFVALPAWLKLFLPSLIRKGVIKSLYLQGTGRHSPDEVVHMATKTINAIAFMLGDKKYFMGEQLSTIDASAFAFLINILVSPYDDLLKNILKKHENCRLFCNRMWRNFYPEIPLPSVIEEKK